jgi:hypothetical protein
MQEDRHKGKSRAGWHAPHWTSDSVTINHRSAFAVALNSFILNCRQGRSSWVKGGGWFPRARHPLSDSVSVVGCFTSSFDPRSNRLGCFTLFCGFLRIFAMIFFSRILHATDFDVQRSMLDVRCFPATSAPRPFGGLFEINYF